MKCRRFRLENGEGVGDRDEVNYFSFFYLFHQEIFQFCQLQFAGLQFTDHARFRESRISNALVFQIFSRQM